MSEVRLPEAIEKALVAYRESNYQTVDDNGKRVRRAIAAELLNERQVALLEAKAACEEVALGQYEQVHPAALGCANRIRALLAALEAGGESR